MASSSSSIEHDAWFMNESLAFYLSTNTFRNPVFDFTSSEMGCSSNDHDEDELGEIPSTTSKSVANSQQQQQQQREFNFIKNLRKINYGLKNPREKLETFCDNFLFAIKGKVFVIKLNFKHRLNRFKKFINKRLPSSNKQLNNNNNLDVAQLGREEGRSNSSRSSAAAREETNGYLSASSTSSSSDSLFWNKIKPPNSTRSLELQQARLLNRLEKAKRDSQKLLNTENHFLRHFGDSNTCDDWEWSQEESAANKNSGHLGQSSSSTKRQRRLARGRYSSHRQQQQPSQVPTDLFGGMISTSNKKSGGSQLLEGKPKRGGNRVHSSPTESGSIVTKSDAKRAAAHTSGAADRSKKICIVCYTNRPNIVTLPCEHNDICSHCFIEIIFMAVKNSQYPLKCVLCRQKVEKVRCSS